jgi:hypothetical protein
MKLFIKELKRISYLYFRNLFIAVDQLVNTLFYGDPDETISSRLGKNYPNGRLTKIVNWLFRWQKHDEGHCKGTIEHDEGDMSILK